MKIYLLIVYHVIEAILLTPMHAFSQAWSFVVTW